MRCKDSDPNPATCISKGQEVHACVIGLERTVRKSCKEPWNNYAKCLWKNNNEFKKCRPQQEALEAAWAELKASGK